MKQKCLLSPNKLVRQLRVASLYPYLAVKSDHPPIIYLIVEMPGIEPGSIQVANINLTACLYIDTIY